MNLVQSGWTKIIKKKLLSLDIKEKKIIIHKSKSKYNMLLFHVHYSYKEKEENKKNYNNKC